MESNSITRIADLPSSNSNAQGTQPLETISISSMKTKQMSDEQVNYTPINVHPNPYGISDQNPIMNNPEIQPERPNITIDGFQNNLNDNMKVPDEYRNVIQSQPVQKLPSRDIPMNQEVYNIDQQIKPNYVPQSENDDYVRRHNDMTEENVRMYEQKKKNENKLDNLLNLLQMPVFVGLLYFLFNSPMVSVYMFKHLSFLRIYNDDGNFNLFGLILKSVIFGVFYLIFNSTIDLLMHI